MKPQFTILPQTRFGACVLLAAIAMLVLASPRARAAELNATYNTEAEVPVTANGFTAKSHTVNIRLNFAPKPGTQLTVVKNTGPDLIRGKFSNLAEGQVVPLIYQGVTYQFVAHYYGGAGKDLVLLWTTDDPSLPARARSKLDHQLLLDLKKSRGDPPFDKSTTLHPEVYEYRGRVLVEINGTFSKDLAAHIANLGGQVVPDWGTSTQFRAWLPVAQLPDLASNPEIKSIAAAKPSITHRLPH
jgi:hypothetical protein